MQKVQHILIVDDARDIREPLAQYLKKNGFRTTLAANALEARSHMNDIKFDLIILDIMMPGEDGLKLCSWIAANEGPPVILLTAMVDDASKVVGLEIGADDYLTKPFNPRELLARIKVILRRLPETKEVIAPTYCKFSDMMHDPLHHKIIKQDGTELQLTTGESRLLSVFLNNPNRVFDRGKLLEIVSGREAKAYDRAIDNTISRLRKKIETDPKSPEFIVTQWGGGYMFVCDVEVV